MSIKQRILYNIGRVVDKLLRIRDEYSLLKYQRLSKQSFKFVNQGNGGLTIGHPENLQIDSTSHFKSNTFIDAWGG